MTKRNTNTATVPPELISVGELMKELRQQMGPQLEFLRKYKEGAERIIANGRGHSHYVTAEVAERLRKKVAKTRQPTKPTVQLALVQPPPPPADEMRERLMAAPNTLDLHDMLVEMHQEIRDLRADLAHWGVTK